MGASFSYRDCLQWVEQEGRVTHSRSSGPGGQRVNKVSTKVTLFLPLDRLPVSENDRARAVDALGNRVNSDNELVVSSSETPSQHTNLIRAQQRAASLLSSALVRPKKRRPTRASRAARERRLSEKKRRSDVKKYRGPVRSATDS